VATRRRNLIERNRATREDKGADAILGSVSRDPRPRLALRGRDLGVRHLPGDFLAQRHGVLAALQRGEVEPFMCGDEVDEAGAAARPIDPALEQHVRQRARVDRRRRLQIESTLKHNASPFFLPPRSPERGSRPKTCSTHPHAVCRLVGGDDGGQI